MRSVLVRKHHSQSEQIMSEPFGNSSSSLSSADRSSLLKQFSAPESHFKYSCATKRLMSAPEERLRDILEREVHNSYSGQLREQFADAVRQLLVVVENRDSEILALRQHIFELKDCVRDNDMAVGLAINEAARTLPEGWCIALEIERGSGGARLEDSCGNVICADFSDNRSLSSQVFESIDQAHALTKMHRPSERNV